jgi:cbb3-type cytochrome oxidase maturation protein
MSILYLLVPVALVLAGVSVWAFAWAVRNGQFEDTKTPAFRMLWEDEESIKPNHVTNGRSSENAEESSSAS